jgi:hypothetical protein
VQSWEYLEVVLGNDSIRADKTNLIWRDSMGRSGDLQALVFRFANSAPLLNELGAQGWELVGVQPSSDVSGHYAKYILKRPRAQSSL